MKHNKGNRVGKSILAKAMMAVFAVGVVACNASDKSGIKVANGTIDGSDGQPMQYPATVYVDMTGNDLNGRPVTIRNVGTLAEVDGLSQDKVALVLSLADVFTKDASGQSIPVLPLLDTVNLTLYNGVDQPVVISGLKLNFNSFILENTADKSKTYRMYSVGIKSQQTGSLPNGVTQSNVASASQALLMESPMDIGGLHFRTPETAYQFLSILRSDLAGLHIAKYPKLIPADQRASVAGDLFMVGYGENKSAGVTGQKLALSDSMLSVRKRNYAPVKMLNTSASDQTPLGKILGSSPFSKQLWEVAGSGLCGTSGQGNYDTGAAVYAKDRAGNAVFLGFGVRSTAKTSGFMGMLQCNGIVKYEDMTTAIVSPSQAEIAGFLSR